jgi:hypothetical protein
MSHLEENYYILLHFMLKTNLYYSISYPVKYYEREGYNLYMSMAECQKYLCSLISNLQWELHFTFKVKQLVWLLHMKKHELHNACKIVLQEMTLLSSNLLQWPEGLTLLADLFIFHRNIKSKMSYDTSPSHPVWIFATLWQRSPPTQTASSQSVELCQ